MPARRPGPAFAGLAIAAALWALSFAAKWPVLHAPPYWDEGLHYWTARHLGTRWDALTDVWGNPAGVPQHLLFQRPLFYVAFWLPAQGGFQAFRTAHALAASVLAPMAYALVRVHGGRRAAGILAGAAVALVPSVAMWGNLGLMDSLMTACVGLMLWARARRRDGLLFVASLAAVWVKETAYVAVVGLLAWELAVAWVHGRLSLAPLRLDGRLSALAWAAALAPWPLVWAVTHDLAMPGAASDGGVGPVVDRVLTTPWLLPVLVVGLARRRSRFLCGFALAGGAFLVALQLAARDVPQWYEVPTSVFALVAAASAADAWWRPPTAGWARPWPAVLAFALVAMLVAVPNSPERDRLRPFSLDGGNDLRGAWEFETEFRDGDLHAAFAALPLDRGIDVLDVDVAPPALFGTVVGHARHVYVDSSLARTYLEFGVAQLAARIEDATTWTLLDRSGLPMALAIEQTYADCAVLENPGYLVLHGAACAGRADRLEAAWRANDPRL